MQEQSPLLLLICALFSPCFIPDEDVIPARYLNNIMNSGHKNPYKLVKKKKRISILGLWYTNPHIGNTTHLYHFPAQLCQNPKEVLSPNCPGMSASQVRNFTFIMHLCVHSAQVGLILFLIFTMKIRKLEQLHLLICNKLSLDSFMACISAAQILAWAVVVWKSLDTYSLGEVNSLSNREILLPELMMFHAADLN